MTYSASILALSPYVYLRLGDTSGTTAADSSGNSRNGTYIGSPTLNTAGLLIGDTNPAVTFSSGNYATVPDDNGLDGLSALTIVALVNPSVIQLESIAARDGGSSNRSFQFRIDAAGKLSFAKIPATVTAVSTTTLAAGSTYHVAVVYNGTDIRLYVNGALDGTPAAATGSLGTFVQDLYVGRRFSGDSFTGVIDELAVFTSALTATQMANLYTDATNGSGTLATLTGTWGLVA